MILDEIVSIERVPYSGTVHNLTIEEDQSYTVDGLAVHNCMCYKVSVLQKADEFVNQLRGWMRGETSWPAMDRYAEWLDVRGGMASPIQEPGLLASWGSALVTWLWGNREALEGALGIDW